jgi:hypothetical protein
MKQIIFICTVFISLTAIAQEKKVTWDYPVRPSSEEWKTTSYMEKIERSQPPEDLLRGWDTETLFQYCLAYPFNKVVLMYNNPNDGFKRVYEQSLVWQEFVGRKDALSIFGKYYRSISYKQLFAVGYDETNRNDALFSLFFLDKLVSETTFSERLDVEQKKELIDIVLFIHLDKKNYTEFTGFHYNASLSAISRVLDSDKTLSSNERISLTTLRERTDNEYFVDDSIDVKIVIKAKNYLKK